jgi:hypothetical protein
MRTRDRKSRRESVMKKVAGIRVLFAVAAFYDGLLGLGFLLAGPAVFQWADVTPPNHFGYVQFPGALLVVFALMFLAVARRPVENRRLIPYGILLKVSYAGVVLYYWFAVGIPLLWKPFAVADIIFVVAFAWAYIALGSRTQEQ